MQTLSIPHLIHRRSLTVGTALAALLALAPLSAAPTPGSLGQTIAAEAKDLETMSVKLRQLVKSKADAGTLSGEIEQFRTHIGALRSKVEAYDAANLNAQQRRDYELIRDKVRLLDQMASNKANLVERDSKANQRLIRAKAANLVDRTRLLAKAAESANLPAAPGAELD